MIARFILLLTVAASFGAFAEDGRFCNGKKKSDSFGTYYPNGNKVMDDWGAYYPNGKKPFDNWGLYYPNGSKVKDNWGVYYPNGKKIYDNWGCYSSNGDKVDCGENIFRAIYRFDSGTRIRIAVNKSENLVLPMEFTESTADGELTYRVDFQSQKIEDVDLICER